MATKDAKTITPSKPKATIAKAQGKDPKAATTTKAAPAKAPAKTAPAAKPAPAKAAPAAKPATKAAPAKAPAKAAPAKTPSKPAATLAKAESKKADGKDGNKKIYHVSKRDNDGREWKVFIQGSDKVIRVCKTQAEALKIAQDFAKNDGNATVMLHGLDGKIRKA